MISSSSATSSSSSPLGEPRARASRQTSTDTATLVAVVFLSGVQLVFMSVMGEYVGRIYEEVKRRPRYVVSRRLHVKPTSNVPGSK